MEIGDRALGPIGIIGAGHLGGTLARELLRHGLAPSRLLLSTGGTPEGMDRLRAMGLADNRSSNERIAATCPLIFVTLRPRGWAFLADLAFAPNVTIVSTIAGVSAATLERLMHRKCVHIMPSGPDTIQSGKGICSIFPPDTIMTELISAMGIRAVPLDSEEEMQVFTAAVCLPAVAVVAQALHVDLASQWTDIAKAFPKLVETFRWARDAAPALSSETERRLYVERMATKGGITEVIVESFRAGQSMTQSLANGIERCKDIATSSR